MNKNNKRPVVFLDRDGTLNEEVGYIRDAENLVLINGAGESIKRLNDAGVAAILVTNQSGVARQYYPESHIGVLHSRLQKLLADHGATLDAIYYCPHLPVKTDSSFSGVCDCRKPATGMIDLAYNNYPELDRQKSFMVGDKVSDIELAKNCQARSILVKTGYGEASFKELQEKKLSPDYVAEDVCQAVDWILSKLGQ